MGRVVAIGVQDFGDVIRKKCFLVDKTMFIKEWWENEDAVTLITRPRRFGKTLNMSMLDYFFSNRHSADAGIFEGLAIWNEKSYQKLQGRFPVISLTFADIKQTTFESTYIELCRKMYLLYEENCHILQGKELSEEEKRRFADTKERLYSDHMDRTMAARQDAEKALQSLSCFLSKYYGEKVLIFLDEYDTPMQEAYVHGYWDEMVLFIRSMFNAAFKTNPYMSRAVMTGITRISKESIFSDLNNPAVITTSSEKYADAFGFTEREVYDAMDEMGLEDRELVKRWYDGFTFGGRRDIYNPWSIVNYLDKGKVGIYWANSSGNRLVSRLLSEGRAKIKMDFETLLKGESIRVAMDEQIVFDQLNKKKNAVWSLLVAAGYLKVVSYTDHPEKDEFEPYYELMITNGETRRMFREMVGGWFGEAEDDYDEFVKAMFAGNVKEMNAYMNRVALQSFSYFDSGKSPSEDAPERFYHGFVLGLLVKTSDRYEIKSNRESGFGRYDVMLLPKNPKDGYGYILEFKVHDPEEENTLQDTAAAALQQIDEKKYETELLARGIRSDRIRTYGFAFEGKKVLIAAK